MQVDWAVVFATMAGPILAVWASEYRQSNKQVKENRHKLFYTLMSTRATRLNPAHVEALNQIDFLFEGKSFAQVRESWALYRKHLQSPESGKIGEAFNVWLSKSTDLFADLLHEISKALSLPFSKSYIIENSYRPDAHLYEEINSQKMRQLILEVLENGRPINIRTINEVKTET
jgi:hypothetical protein